MGNASERKIVCLKAVFQHQLLRTQHGSEMPADQAVNSTFTDISFRVAFLIPYAKAGTGYDRQMCRRLHSLITPVDRLMQFHRALDPHKGIDTDTVTVTDQADRLIRAHKFIHFVPTLLLNKSKSINCHEPIL